MNSDVFEKLEILNAAMDIYIDEEDYDNIDKRVEINDIKARNTNAISLKECYSEVFKEGKTCTRDDDALWYCLTDSKLIRPVKSVSVNGLAIAVRWPWSCLFWAKLLRARIQQKGSDCYFRRLDHIVTYLEGCLPQGSKQVPKTAACRKEPRLREKLSILFLLEMASAGEGADHVSFAERARRVLRRYFEKEDQLFYSFYDLIARYSIGVGHFHQKRYRKAVREFNYIVWEVTDFVSRGDKRKASHFARRLAHALLYQQAVLYRADVQLKLQLAYHTFNTLEHYLTDYPVPPDLSSYKESRCSLMRAEAWQQMGDYAEARQALNEAAAKSGFDLSLEPVDMGGQLVNLKGLTQSLYVAILFDELRRQPIRRLNPQLRQNVADLKDFFIRKDHSVELVKENRFGRLEQVVAYIGFLAKEGKRLCESDLPQLQELGEFFNQVGEDVYGHWRESLLAPESRQLPDCPCQTKGVDLRRLTRTHYHEFTQPILAFFDNTRTGSGLREDRRQFLDRLLHIEKEEGKLQARIRRFELQKDGIDAVPSWGCKNCLPKHPLSFSFCNKVVGLKGLLACDVGKIPESYMSANDYEMMMDTWTDRFFNHLEYNTRHEPRMRAIHFLGLQRWNSTSPAMGRSLGGGYLIYHTDDGGKLDLGVAVDPGFDFVKNLFHEGFSLLDIDIVLLSHAHVDHLRDFEALVSLLFELAKHKHRRKKVQVIMTLSVYKRLEFFIESYGFREFIEPYVIDIEKEIDGRYPDDLPTFEYYFDNDTASNGDVVRWKARIKRDDPKQVFSIKIEPKVMYHDDHTDQSDTFGFVIRLSDEPDKGNSLFCTVGYTSDTSWYEGVMDHFKDCSALVVHMGSLIDRSVKRRFDHYIKPSNCFALVSQANHPYLFGTLHLLSVADRWPKVPHTGLGSRRKRLVLLSEFGEELRGGIRVDLAKRLNEVYQNLEILPVDVGLDVVLGQEKGEEPNPPIARCEKCRRFFAPNDVTFVPFGHDEALYCLCKTCKKSTSYDVLHGLFRNLYEVGREPDVCIDTNR